MTDLLCPNFIIPIENIVEIESIESSILSDFLGIDIHLFNKDIFAFKKHFANAILKIENIRISPHKTTPQINLWVLLDSNYRYYLEEVKKLDNIVPRKKIFFLIENDFEGLRDILSEISINADVLLYSFVFISDFKGLNNNLAAIDKINIDKSKIVFYLFANNQPISKNFIEQLKLINYNFLNHPMNCCDYISKYLRKYFIVKPQLLNIAKNHVQNKFSKYLCLCQGLDHLLGKKNNNCQFHTEISEFHFVDELIPIKKKTLYDDWHYIYDSFESL